MSSTAGIDGAAGVSERRLKAPMGVILRRNASQCAASVSCAAVTTEAPAAKRTQAARAATLSIVRARSCHFGDISVKLNRLLVPSDRVAALVQPKNRAVCCIARESGAVDRSAR